MKCYSIEVRHSVLVQCNWFTGSESILMSAIKYRRCATLLCSIEKLIGVGYKNSLALFHMAFSRPPWRLGGVLNQKWFWIKILSIVILFIVKRLMWWFHILLTSVFSIKNFHFSRFMSGTEWPIHFVYCYWEIKTFDKKLVFRIYAWLNFVLNHEISSIHLIFTKAQ